MKTSHHAQEFLALDNTLEIKKPITWFQSWAGKQLLKDKVAKNGYFYESDNSNNGLEYIGERLQDTFGGHVHVHRVLGTDTFLQISYQDKWHSKHIQSIRSGSL